jgi:hypothetical protein
MRFSSACKYLFMRISSGCKVVDIDCSGKLINISRDKGSKQRIKRTVVNEIDGGRRVGVGIR